MKHIRKFEHDGSPDEVSQFFNDLLVEQKFGRVHIPTVELSGAGEVIGAIYDDEMDTVTLVSASDEELLES